MIIRSEQEGDRDAIGLLHRLVFGGEFEAALVERLREERRVALSLVGIIGGQVVGHVLFSDLEVEIDGRKIMALALAPMAVVPVRQRQGIGTKLLEDSLPRLGAGRYEAVLVLGHRDYYKRFGFSSDLAKKLASPFAGESFMALELKAEALAGEKGKAEYPPAFFADQT